MNAIVRLPHPRSSVYIYIYIYIYAYINMYTYHGGIKEISLLYFRVYTNYSYRQLHVQGQQKNLRKEVKFICYHHTKSITTLILVLLPLFLILNIFKNFFLCLYCSL